MARRLALRPVLSKLVVYLLVPAAAVVVVVLFRPPAAMAHGDLDCQVAEVSRVIRQAEALRPLPEHELAQMHLDRAELHRLRRDWRRAEADYNRAARYEPSFHTVERARGHMLLDAGRPRQARAALERFLRLRVNDPEGLLLHARAMLALGAGARAVELLDRALAELKQPEPDHFIARADILVSLGAEQLPQALAGLDAGVARLGPIVSLDTRAIEIELQLGRYESALARVERQAAATVRKDIWHARRADILDRAGRTEQARAARREALRSLAALPTPLRSRKATLQFEQELLAALGE